MSCERTSHSGSLVYTWATKMSARGSSPDDEEEISASVGMHGNKATEVQRLRLERLMANPVSHLPVTFHSFTNYGSVRYIACSRSTRNHSLSWFLYRRKNLLTFQIARKTVLLHLRPNTFAFIWDQGEILRWVLMSLPSCY